MVRGSLWVMKQNFTSSNNDTVSPRHVQRSDFFKIYFNGSVSDNMGISL